MKITKVKRKYIKKIPDLKEFKELSHNLTRSFLKINELYPNSANVSFEICNGQLWIMKGESYVGAISGYLLDDHEDNLHLMAKELQKVCAENPWHFQMSQDLQDD